MSGDGRAPEPGASGTTAPPPALRADEPDAPGTPDLPEWITAAEAAALSGLSKRSIERYMQRYRPERDGANLPLRLLLREMIGKGQRGAADQLIAALRAGERDAPASPTAALVRQQTDAVLAVVADLSRQVTADGERWQTWRDQDDRERAALRDEVAGLRRAVEALTELARQERQARQAAQQRPGFWARLLRRG